MATVTTPHYKIYKYWSDKIITSDGKVIDIGDEAHGSYNVVVSDDYCPRCWGCGSPVVKDSKIDDWISKHCVSDDEEANLARIWNSKETRHELNRCHIIPGALGGEDAPHNLFLMCEDCHVLSPDTKYPSSFFKWVLERRKQMLWGTWSPNYVMEQVDSLLMRDYGIGLIDLLTRIHELGGDNSISDLQEFMRDRVGTHGVKIVESTAMVAVEKWLVSIYTDLSLE